MAVRVYLSGGVEFRVRLSLEQMGDAYQTAIGDGRLLRIRSDNGVVRDVNPHQVLYLEEEEKGE